MNRIVLLTATDGVAARHVEIASNTWQRLRGLLGRDTLGEDVVCYLAPCRAVHTVGMRFAIDLAFVDRQGEVVRTIPALPPGRLAWGGWRAHGVYEASAGWLNARAIRVGERLRRMTPSE